MDVRGHLEPRDGSIGLDHELVVWEGKFRLWHDWVAWQQVRRLYLRLATSEKAPNVVLARNLNPVFNQFVRWLRHWPSRPRLVLVLADSSTLGQRVRFSRRLRYAVKPMQTLDERAIKWYDACIGFGITTRRYFEPRGVPWMWMPSAPNFSYDPPPSASVRAGPIRFGYFGALAEHAAVLPMAQTFLRSGVQGTLHICGFGRLTDALKDLALQHPTIRFDGVLGQQECLAWAQNLDVLINPRLRIWGLENSFPSKIFEYGMTGKAILTTSTGGVDHILGEEGLYFDAETFERSLLERLCEISRMDRGELDRRGATIRERLVRDFNWDAQGRRMIEFLQQIASSCPG
jgi:glycosyltransferase involved in cell wall biosynthesis